MNKKGKEIVYEGFDMPSYLQPNEHELSIDDQRYIYAMRNKMADIPAHYGSVCGGEWGYIAYIQLYIFEQLRQNTVKIWSN